MNLLIPVFMLCIWSVEDSLKERGECGNRTGKIKDNVTNNFTMFNDKSKRETTIIRVRDTMKEARHERVNYTDTKG